MAGVHHFVIWLARVMAVLGGLILTALILITCVSILGRAANSFLHSDFIKDLAPGLAQTLLDAGIGAIRGDFELVEAGMAFCIFAFLPYCQVTAGHASVDVFTNALPQVARRVLETLIAAVFAVVLVIIALQLNQGLARKMSSGQTTLLLQFPVWWSYALCLCGAVMAALAGVYMVLVRIYELVTGVPVAAIVTRAGQ